MALTMLARTDPMERDGGRRTGPEKERLCAVRRVPAPLEELLRFVVGPDEHVVPDLKNKLPGRGVWVTADRKTLEAAVRGRVFARSFKREVGVPPHLTDVVEGLLRRHALDTLAMAVKAGEAIAGFTKVEAAIANAPVIGLVHAREAAADGIRKLQAAFRHRFGEVAESVPVVGAFTSAQLDLAFGRSNVVHAALLAGSASKGFLGRCRRLERFMGPADAAASNA